MGHEYQAHRDPKVEEIPDTGPEPCDLHEVWERGRAQVTIGRRGEHLGLVWLTGRTCPDSPELRGQSRP